MPKRLDVTWTGLDELLRDMNSLASDLTIDANPILLESAQAAKADIAAAYPIGGTGHLRQGLEIQSGTGPTQAGATLVQRAPHGWIYEHGTKVRENAAGANRGATQPHPTFDPISAAHQRTALQAVIDRLKAHGAATVTGEIPTVETRTK